MSGRSEVGEGESRGKKKTRRKISVTPRTNQALFQQVQPSYVLQQHLRRVRPYYFEHQVYAKKRWLGLTLREVFLNEFRDRTEEYYQAAMTHKLIMVNGIECTLDHILCDSDLISHRMHRHEPPVSSSPIEILFQNESILVVNKPASIPVHPSGRYRFNSLVEILKNELNLSNSLGLVNRLDRLTSGVCILSLGRLSSQLHELMSNRKLRKTYLARVSGHFPSGTITCDKKLRLLDHKLGVVVADDELGKEAHTVFHFLRTIGDDTLVCCEPSTGRTHQIRVHLLHIGYPIVNDPLYNNPCWSNPDLLLEKKLEILMNFQIESERSPDLQDGNLASKFVNNDSEANFVAPPLCADCVLPAFDPKPEQLCIYLHAHHYSCEDWSYSASPPPWATE